MKQKGKKIFYTTLMLIAGAVFLFSAYKVGTMLYQYYLQDQEKETLLKMVNLSNHPETEPFTIDWKALKETNADVIGWILIPDTNISYPIVQGNDNAYYLNHTVEKTYLYSGAIFLDAHAKADFHDRNTIIYGHNIKYGTMFAQLEKFKDEDFFRKHPYIYIFTPDKNYRCEVFSIYTTKATSPSYKTQFINDDDFADYLNMVTKNSDHKSEYAASKLDHIVTLSTCSYEAGGEASELRYLLHARMVTFEGTYQVNKS